MIGRRARNATIGPRTSGGPEPAHQGRTGGSLKRTVAAAAIATVLGFGVLAASSAPVLASGGTATPFKAAYSDAGTEYECSGVRIVNRVSVKDSETCLITGDTSWLYAGFFAGDPYGDVPGCTHCLFVSDYDGRLATSWSTTVVDDGDGVFTAYVVMYF